MSSSGPNNPDPWGNPSQDQNQPTGWERPGSDSQSSQSSQSSQAPSSASSASGADWPGYPGSQPYSQPSAPEPTRPLNDPPDASQTGYQPYEQMPSYGSAAPTPPPAGGSYGTNPYDQQQVNPYQQNPYQPYGAYQAYAVAPQHPQATTSFILGLLGLVLCPPVGIGGFVMGGRVRREIDASGGAQGGRGLATAGWVLGILSIIYTGFLVLYLIFIVVMIATGGFGS